MELSDRARGLLRQVHTIARTYHWSERDVLTLEISRRAAYLLLIEEDADAALLAELGAGAP